MTKPWLAANRSEASVTVFPQTGVRVPAECAAALASLPLARHDVWHGLSAEEGQNVKASRQQSFD
jgi:hypothetical protein